MTYTEFYAKINAGVAKHGDDYRYIGVRFADQLHQVGDKLGPSKHNPDRDDERDFPEYGTPEYDELPTLPGTSCWGVYDGDYQRADEVDVSKVRSLSKPFYIKDDNMRVMRTHAYLIAGNRTDTHSDADDGEVVIVDATVIEVLF